MITAVAEGPVVDLHLRHVRCYLRDRGGEMGGRERPHLPPVRGADRRRRSPSPPRQGGPAAGAGERRGREHGARRWCETSDELEDEPWDWVRVSVEETRDWAAG